MASETSAVRTGAVSIDRDGTRHVETWTTLPWVYDDGGRAEAGFRGRTGDCTTRAIAIATATPYRQVYDDLNALGRAERRRTRKRSSSREGVARETSAAYLRSLGWRWTPTMSIGSGTRVHLRAGELPGGRLIVSLSRHLAAVIDGVVHDTYDPGRGGTRAVYGYWTPPEEA